MFIEHTIQSYLTKGGSGAKPRKKFWGLNKPPFLPYIKTNFLVKIHQVEFAKSFLCLHFLPFLHNFTTFAEALSWR